MSVDFAFFDPDVAPRDGKRFRAWFREQVDWDIDAPAVDPQTLSQSLFDWYNSMIERFPDLNRALSADDYESDAAIEYGFTKHFMYCSMPSAHADKAWEFAQQLAVSLKLGKYDIMSDDGRDNRCIVFPDGPLANDPSWLSRIFGKTKG